MPPEIPDFVRDYLTSHYTMTLATCRDDRPWAATVFYVCDQSLRLYFVSDSRTRHATEGEANPNVAVTIYAHDQAWETIRGVQIEGRLGIVSGMDRLRVAAMYAARFPSIGRLLLQPDTAQESVVASRFARATFYVVSPGRLRLIDNTRAFGHKDEYVLDEASQHQ